MTRKQPRYVRVTVAEPFPVFYSHVSQKCRRANDPATEGPFYKAGSSWFVAYTPENLVWKRASADHLAKDGYTVTVEVVERAAVNRNSADWSGDEWQVVRGEGFDQ